MPGEDFIDISSDHEDEADEVEVKPSESNEEGEASDRENVQETLNLVKTEEYSIKLSSNEKNTEAENVYAAVEEVIENASVTKTKRSRASGDGDERPSVHVVYKSLSGASRRRLGELLQEWSEWHTRNLSSSNGSTKDQVLEDGEETYFPVLCGEKSTIVSFRVDKKARPDGSGNEDSELTPLYDRGFSLGLTFAEDPGSAKRVEASEASRCFNCGSYSHSMKECPRPRDATAVALARSQHSAKKNSSSGQRNNSRYYESSDGKFDGLKPGVLSPELRRTLGIGEFDPPPWLNRMRELGYPPGYLDEGDDDGPSGITIFGEEEIKFEGEEGELPERGKRMAVDFPGINAPIPDKADHRLWAVPPGTPTGRRRSPPGLDAYARHHPLSRTESHGERDRERGLLSSNRSPQLSSHNTFSDRWVDDAGRHRHQHRHHHHHQQHYYHHHDRR